MAWDTEQQQQQQKDRKKSSPLPKKILSSPTDCELQQDYLGL